MAFVLLGVLMIALKLLDIGAVSVWSWWVVLAPFPMAMLWWWWADMSGYTKRKEMDKMDERRAARRRKSLEALGLDPRAFDRQKRKAAAFKRSQQARTEKIESKRDETRRKQRDSVLSSRFDSSQMQTGAQDTSPGGAGPGR